MEHCLKVLSDGDDFADLIFSDECSVNIEHSTRRSFHKVGEPRRLKGKPKHPLKVSLRLQFPSFRAFLPIVESRSQS